MNHAPAPEPPATVRVLVDDVPELDEQVIRAARLAQDTDRAVELVERAVAEDDHEAKARVIRRMDEALEVARRAAPGIEIRVGPAPDVPRPRAAS